MGFMKTPRQPDPIKTAQAQGVENRNAAISTQLINMVDQYGPDGNFVFKRGADESYTDENGVRRTTPRFSLTTTLNPTQQAAKESEQRVDLNTNQLSERLLGRAQDTLSTPTDYSDDAIMARTRSMINPRLEERFARDRAALEARLINQGVRVGSQAYTDSMGDFEKSRTDTLSQEALNNRRQAIDEMGMSQREIINQIGALMGTGQIASPVMQNTPQAQIAAPDLAGMIYQNAANKTKMNSAAMGGLFGMAGELIGAGGRILGR